MITLVCFLTTDSMVRGLMLGAGCAVSVVDALARWPSLSSSPWILWYPQPWFSMASRSMSAAISALTGGRPVPCG